MYHLPTFLVLLIPAIVFSRELVINGDFEDELGAEWQFNGGISIGNLDESDPDMEARVYINVDYYDLFRYLKQRIDITGYAPECLTFSCAAKLWATNYDVSLYCGAAILVSYHDKYGNRVADTKIAYIDTLPEYSQDTCWPGDTLQNLSFISDSSWHHYSFNVGQELETAGLSNTDTIQYVEIALIDTVHHKKTDARGQCGST